MNQVYQYCRAHYTRIPGLLPVNSLLLAFLDLFTAVWGVRKPFMLAPLPGVAVSDGAGNFLGEAVNLKSLVEAEGLPPAEDPPKLKAPAFSVVWNLTTDGDAFAADGGRVGSFFGSCCETEIKQTVRQFPEI